MQWFLDPIYFLSGLGRLLPRGDYFKIKAAYDSISPRRISNRTNPVVLCLNQEENPKEGRWWFRGKAGNQAKICANVVFCAHLTDGGQ
jgi:hypothetical protein